MAICIGDIIFEGQIFPSRRPQIVAALVDGHSDQPTLRVFLALEREIFEHRQKDILNDVLRFLRYAGVLDRDPEQRIGIFIDE